MTVVGNIVQGQADKINDVQGQDKTAIIEGVTYVVSTDDDTETDWYRTEKSGGPRSRFRYCSKYRRPSKDGAASRSHL